MTIETMTTELRNAAIEALGVQLTLVCTNPGKADIVRIQKGEPSVWQYTLTRNGKSFSGPYTMGCGLREYKGKRIEYSFYGKLTDSRIRELQQSRPIKPTLADILCSLQSDAGCAMDTFEDFCSGLGYDTNNHKTLKTYLTCQQSGVNLRSLGLSLANLQELFQDY